MNALHTTSTRPLIRLLGTALVALAATGQAALGIATLLTSVPVTLAALHQLGAFVLVTSILLALHAVPRPAGERATTLTAPGGQARSA